MELTALFQNVVADRAAEIAISALWQGALIAGALAICLRLLPQILAAYRFAAWAAGFVALLGISISSLLPQFSVGATHSAAQASGNATSGALLNLDMRWSVAIAALWLAVGLVRAVDLAIHSLRLRTLWKDASPVSPVSVDERVAAVLAAASADCGRGPVEICTTTALQRPSVIGFFRPRILIPDWLYARLTRGELEQIVLHEMEHLRRRDDWTNLAQKLCLVMFPLNPALAWIERRLCMEREMACDEGVIRVTRAPRAYAACLASLAERGLERRVEALSLGAWQRRPELVHRVHSILRGESGLNPLAARVLLGTLGFGLVAGSIELAHSPQLVAFVPESRSLAVAAHDSATKSAADASVIVPEVPTAARQRTAARGSEFIAVNASLRQPAAPAALNTRALRVTSDAKAVPVMAKSQPAETGMPQEQQWVVLTAWTQVETTSTKTSSGLRSDYDVAGAGNDDVTMQPEQAPANRIAITQLIFKVRSAAAEQPGTVGQSAAPESPGNPDPNAPNAKPGANDKSASPATSPLTIQPKVAAIRDGWLILQL